MRFRVALRLLNRKTPSTTRMRKGVMSFNSRPQVLVVDDDLAMCGFLRAFLAARGYFMDKAPNG